MDTNEGVCAECRRLKRLIAEGGRFAAYDDSSDACKAVQVAIEDYLENEDSIKANYWLGQALKRLESIVEPRP